MLAPIFGEASDYLLICSGTLAAFSYLGLPTHGLGTRLKVDNIVFTLVMTHDKGDNGDFDEKIENPRPTRRN